MHGLYMLVGCLKKKKNRCVLMQQYNYEALVFFLTTCPMCRYSVTVKQMDLKKVSSPAQRKRLLSLAAADSESGRMSRCEAGEDEMQQLDSDSEADLTPTTETEENGTHVLYAYT